MNKQLLSFDDFVVRTFELDEDNIDELTYVLNSAYKQLDEMGFRYLATHQDSSITRKRILGAHCLVGLKNDEIISTITYSKPGNKKGSTWYETEGVGAVEQFGVLPSYQSIGLGAKMLSIIESMVKDEGVDELALDTAEGASHLRSFYTKRGYRMIEYVDWGVTNYRSVVMSKKLN
ncbi:GNAT family N-acetyltransferase [Oceanobacillus kimchii]|uniref:N-acetyltransferase domain-containing protein n=1 Tax=Oceanobacillus kimchii TaxID=746691 RepID=A0ABQ5TSS9_9BACI|nr:GNAT family N-acetyltransferase [Oceanobacillus kimchii]GLO68082.1 hypothetical protein MACH08_38660 [Oceanobacillus kimchii]